MKAIIDQHIAVRQTCCYIPPWIVRIEYINPSKQQQSATSGDDHKQGEHMLQDNSIAGFECWAC